MQMLSLSLKKELDKAVKSYESQMTSPEGLIGVHYLKNRGISKEAATYFRLGFVNVPEENDEFEQGRLCIPYVTPTGIVGLKFRAVPISGKPGDPEPSPKYKYRAGFQTTLFNTRDLLRPDPLVCITEGELDAISAWMAGYPAIGVAGVNNWQQVFARAFRYRKVAILADNDDAGQGLEFAKRVQSDVKGSRIVLMPTGMDVNKLVSEEGIEALQNLIGKKKSE